MVKRKPGALKCVGCKKSLGKGQRLKYKGPCRNWFHGKIECVKITPDQLKRVKNSNENFICIQCRDEMEEENENLTSEDESISEEEPEENPSKFGLKRTNTNKKVKIITLENIMKKLDNVIDESKFIRKKMESLEKENRLVTAKLEKIEKEHTQMKEDIENLNKENKRLKNNVIIYGLPVTTDSKDEVKKVVKENTECLDVDIDNEEFECSVIGREGVKQVKVEFKNRELKDATMRAKKRISLNSRDYGFEKHNDIYINHDMSFETQKLFKEARNFKKSYNYKFAWFSDGKILLRKKEDSPVIHVKSANILENLKPKSEEKN
ncbi:hypothetical protein WA026_019926 [Henosepilachna vigintioctopunctata]|uniref:FP protein C-terminal domain-containing protein n=1 Tax=Henosepilachna vigintioctopunctata TaxID=420089 RepID=A0AAW1V1N5_9CUCU